jgi:endogenous inhibitor of DNA gyrase (YacG/DUF329 family)
LRFAPSGLHVDVMAAPAKPRLKKCPICGRPAAGDTRPFCSVRCKEVDLHRWLSGGYVIATTNDDEDGRSSG